MRAVIAAARMAALLAVTAAGVVLVVLVLSWLQQRRHAPLLRGFARVVLAACGVRLRIASTGGEDPRQRVAKGEPGHLILSNHVSWLDVFAIGAVLPIRFVAKSEIARWPVVGWLATRAGTLYIERGRRHAVAAMNHRVRAQLQAGQAVAIFAEGTTTDGTKVLPFHSNLIAPALDVEARVWPVALRYTQGRERTTVTAFDGDVTLAQSLGRVLRARGVAVELALLAPVNADGKSRHEIAAAVRREIATHLGLEAAARSVE